MNITGWHELTVKAQLRTIVICVKIEPPGVETSEVANAIFQVCEERLSRDIDFSRGRILEGPVQLHEKPEDCFDIPLRSPNWSELEVWKISETTLTSPSLP